MQQCRRQRGSPLLSTESARGLGQAQTIARQASPIATAVGLIVCRWRASTPICVKKSAGSEAMRRPSRSFTCDSAISTAMPLVKPMTIGTGTKRTIWPSRKKPIAISSTPAIMVEISRLAMP